MAAPAAAAWAPGPWAQGGRCSAKCCFSALVGPHMVLQRETPARVFGTATALADITISLETQNYTTIADATGAWKIDLNARP